MNFLIKMIIVFMFGSVLGDWSLLYHEKDKEHKKFHLIDHVLMIIFVALVVAL